MLLSLLPLFLASLCFAAEETDQAQSGFTEFVLGMAKSSPRRNFAGKSVSADFQPDSSDYRESLINLAVPGISTFSFLGFIFAALTLVLTIGFCFGRWGFDSCGGIRRHGYKRNPVLFWRSCALISFILIGVFVILGYVANNQISSNLVAGFDIISDAVTTLENDATFVSTRLSSLDSVNSSVSGTDSAALGGNLTEMTASADSIRSLSDSSKDIVDGNDVYRQIVTHAALATALVSGSALFLGMVLNTSFLSWTSFFVGSFASIVLWLGFSAHLPTTLMVDDFCYGSTPIEEQLGYFLDCVDNTTVSAIQNDSKTAQDNIFYSINTTTCENKSPPLCWQGPDNPNNYQNMTILTNQNCSDATYNYTLCDNVTLWAESWIDIYESTPVLVSLAECQVPLKALGDISDSICIDLLNSISQLTGSIFFLSLVLYPTMLTAIKGSKRFHKVSDIHAGELFGRDDEMSSDEESTTGSGDRPWWKRKKPALSDDDTDNEDNLKKGDEAVTTIRHQTLHHVNQVRKGDRVPMMDQNEWDEMAESDPESGNEPPPASRSDVRLTALDSSVAAPAIATTTSGPILSSDEHRALANARNDDKATAGSSSSEDDDSSDGSEEDDPESESGAEGSSDSSSASGESSESESE